jgi:hypothetical protein
VTSYRLPRRKILVANPSPAAVPDPAEKAEEVLTDPPAPDEELVFLDQCIPFSSLNREVNHVSISNHKGAP